MKYLLDELNLKSYNDIKLLFLNLSRSIDTISISSDFEKSDYYSSVPQCLSYLPEHIHTIKFEGVNEHRFFLPSFLAEYVPIPKIGQHLVDFVKVLPSWIHTLKLAFSFARGGRYYDAQQQVLSISEGFIRLFANIPSHIRRLDLDGCTMFTSYSELVNIFSSIPAHITELNIGQFKIGQFSVEERQEILKAIPITVQKVSFAFNYFYYDKSTRNLIRMFSGIHSEVYSLSLAHNKLGLPKDSLPFKALMASVIASFPKLENLNLRANNFNNYFEKDFYEECLKVMPHKLKNVDLSENQILTYKCKNIYSKLPPAVQSIDIADSILSNAYLDVIHNLQQLPLRIKILKMTQTSWLGLNAEHFSLVLLNIPLHIHTLDLSENFFHTRLIEDIVEVLKSIPAHITQLILKRNFLSSIPFVKFKSFMKAIPDTVQLIDLTDNGLEQLPYSMLNHFLDAVPDVEVRLNFEKIALHPNGTLVPNSHREEYLVHPSRLFHQKETAPLLIGLSQIFRDKRIPFSCLELIASYVILDRVIKKNTVSSQLRNLCSYHFMPNQTQQHFDEKISMRIAQANEFNSDRLDYSFMGMFLNNDKAFISNALKKIPSHVRYVNLSFNRRSSSKQESEAMFVAMKDVPKTVQVLDLRGNGFEYLTANLLMMWLGAIPSHIKVLLSEDVPLTLTNYALRLSIPDRYRTMTAGFPKFLNKAEILLDDYTQGDSLLRRILVGYWNRNHIQVVDKIVWKIRKDMLMNIRDVIYEFSAIRLKNDNGSLAKIITFLIHELEKVEAPNQISSQDFHLIRPT